MYIAIYFCRNQVTDLIARHKEAEVRRLEIEKTFQTEIDNKQKEIDYQKEHIQTLREIHDGKSHKAREDLEEVRLNMDKKHEDSRKEIEKQLEDLFEMKLKQCREAEEAAEEIAKEREEVARFMEGEWQKVVQYEMKLADIELHRRKLIAQAEIERVRQEELHALEMENDLKGLEEQQVELLELQEKLEIAKAEAEGELNRDKLTLDSTLAENLAELDELEQKIQLIAEKHDQYMTFLSSVDDSVGSEEDFDERTVTKVDYSDETRRISDAGLTSKTVALDLRQRRRASWNFPSRKFSASGGANDDAVTQQLQRLFELKNEKEEIIEKTRSELTREITNVEFYGRQILENEAKITELEEMYKTSRQQHAEKIRLCLESLKIKEEQDIALVDQDRERYVELLWKEYGEIESLISETFESLNSSDTLEGETTSDVRVNDEKKLEVLNLVKKRLRQIGSDEDVLFLEYVAKRAHFEKDEDRVHEQQRKISEKMMDGIKEKEVALLKLSGQKERFHVERARERRLITSRIGRLSRVKSSGDLHNEEALEFFKEEARKLRETFEKVEESEMR